MAAANLQAAILMVIISTCWKVVRCQLEFLGPDLCLISRTEIIPCVFPGAPVTPGPNEFVEFETVFVAALPPRCFLNNQVTDVRAIDSIGSTNPVFSFFSPEFNLIPSGSYPENRYVEYNFDCGEGRIAFLNITEIDMQGKTCTNPNLNDAEVCVDYFRVFRPAGGGFTESCGIDASDNIEQLESGSFTALFRSDGMTNGNGLGGVVVCFDPDEGNAPGCTDSAAQINNQRRRRDLESISKPKRRAKRRSSYMNHPKTYTSPRISVPHGAGITFSDSTLEVTDNRDNMTAIPGLPATSIDCLKVFDGINPERKFMGEARDDSGNLIRFLGPGLLSFECKCVEFQQFVINPVGILPNPVERVMIFELTQAILNTTRVPRDPVTTEMPTTMPTEDPGSGAFMDNEPSAEPSMVGTSQLWEEDVEEDVLDGQSELPSQQRGRRQADAMTMAFEDDIIMLALEQENACNPVLRASANSILESADPERVEDLRSMIL